MLRIYDEFLEDEAVLKLKDRTYRVHVSALIYCAKNLTDGVVTEKAAKVLQAILEFPLRRHITELVDGGLWLPQDSGWLIRNYLEFNPSAATVKAERAKARKRMSELRQKRAGSDEVSGERSGEHAGERSRAVPYQPFPDPSFKSSKALGRLNIDEEQMRRLLVATGSVTRESVDKLTRTIVANRCGERAVALAIEAATGMGVRDPLAVALSELKKRRAA